MINPGKLNKKIIIQTKTAAFDTFHQPIETWADTVTVYANIITTGGGELYIAQKLNTSTTALITTRYRAGITNLNRIKYGSRIFEILHVNNVGENNNELLISVKEVV